MFASLSMINGAYPMKCLPPSTTKVLLPTMSTSNPEALLHLNLLLYLPPLNNPHHPANNNMSPVNPSGLSVHPSTMITDLNKTSSPKSSKLVGQVNFHQNSSKLLERKKLTSQPLLVNTMPLHEVSMFLVLYLHQASPLRLECHDIWIN